MLSHVGETLAVWVAPARERGLKFKMLCVKDTASSRSRKGAWIEIAVTINSLRQAFSRSRKGAWIEISYILD